MQVPWPYVLTIGATAIFINALGAPALYIDGGDLTTWNGEGPGLQTGDNAASLGEVETLPGKADLCHNRTPMLHLTFRR